MADEGLKAGIGCTAVILVLTIKVAAFCGMVWLAVYVLRACGVHL